MIRKLLRRILGPPTGDIYIVIDTGYVHTMIVGVSTRQQGAELIRANYADEFVARHLDPAPGHHDEARQHVYDRTIIQNHELQDGDA